MSRCLQRGAGFDFYHLMVAMDTIINIAIQIGCRGFVDMALKAILIASLFIILAANASSQGYMGTVSTGTGIIPALTVGKGSISAANVGATSSLTNLTGSWALDLIGNQERHLNLQMYQEDDLILGAGRMSIGQSSQAVTAAGFLAGDQPTIFISLIDTEQVFRLKLSVSGEAIAGEYDALSQAQSRQSGTVTGRMTFAAGQSKATTLGKSVNPGATSGALLGRAAQSTPGQNEGNSIGHLTEKKSIYKSGNGQGTISSSEESQITSGL